MEILQALSIFVRELSDHDSYVYFNCLVGVSALAERNRDVTLNLLLDLFSGRKSVGDRVDLLNTKDNLEYYDKYLTNLSVRQRAILGESIVRIVKKSGKVLNRNLLAKVISSAIGIARQKSNTEHAQIINSGVDLLRMRVKKENFQFSSPELEGVDIELRNVNQSLLVATTEAADLVLLRQSALSILSEALVTIDWGAAKYLRDILDICVGILTLESGYNEASRACRRYNSYSCALFWKRYYCSELKFPFL